MTNGSIYVLTAEDGGFTLHSLVLGGSNPSKYYPHRYQSLDDRYLVYLMRFKFNPSDFSYHWVSHPITMVQELNTSHLISNMTSAILSPGSRDKGKELAEENLIGRNNLRHCSTSSSGTSISSSSQQVAYLKYLRAKRSFYAQVSLDSMVGATKECLLTWTLIYIFFLFFLISCLYTYKYLYEVLRLLY